MGETAEGTLGRPDGFQDGDRPCGSDTTTSQPSLGKRRQTTYLGYRVDYNWIRRKGECSVVAQSSGVIVVLHVFLSGRDIVVAAAGCVSLGRLVLDKRLIIQEQVPWAVEW